jgi:hypothetical protein
MGHGLPQRHRGSGVPPLPWIRIANSWICVNVLIFFIYFFGYFWKLSSSIQKVVQPKAEATARNWIPWQKYGSYFNLPSANNFLSFCLFLFLNNRIKVKNKVKKGDTHNEKKFKHLKPNAEGQHLGCESQIWEQCGSLVTPDAGEWEGSGHGTPVP